MFLFLSGSKSEDGHRCEILLLLSILSVSELINNQGPH